MIWTSRNVCKVKPTSLPDAIVTKRTALLLLLLLVGEGTYFRKTWML